jgi:protein TonB
VLRSDAPLANAAVSVDSPPPPVPPAGGDHISIEATYEAMLRQIVDEHTSVPASAEYRLAHPTGESRVSFRLDRRGELQNIELARSSGSRILDRRALEIVQTAQYPPFPDNAYPGESRHEFLITIEFRS